MKKRGFTIVELVMVIIVVGILAGVSILAISRSMDDMRLASAADKIASDLAYAKSMANATGQWYGVRFIIDSNKYIVYLTTGTQETDSFVVRLYEDFGVTISSVNFGLGNQIEFSPLGQPYTDMHGIPMATESIITIIRGAVIKTVRITPHTGRIFIQ